ncbi:MAG: GuaB3 family IMP dehydrogenase-related protein [Chloroflexi bacterium]|nr:GuaB3 family IMP dehydrogenase-related protein [Chloroflexota bacterium]
MESFTTKILRQAYGFEEVAIVPGAVTLNPEQTEIGLRIGDRNFALPILAAAMDGVVDEAFATEYSKRGGLAVLNLEGVHGRYKDPSSVINEIVAAAPNEVTAVLQRIYSAPIREEYVGAVVEKMKASGAIIAVSATPANTKWLSPIVVEAGADFFVCQSTVTTANHISSSPRGLRFDELVPHIGVPVIVGNTVGYRATLELMEAGVAAVLVGVGPGSACTSREVLGIGVPQITATIETAAARDEYFRRTGRYVPIITDGGIRNGGDLCKALVAGADAVMLGSILASAEEAPGRGYHWGMATPHPALPRGTRVRVSSHSSLDRILNGPTNRTDGTENLVGAIHTAMGMCGAATIREFQQAEMVIAPSIKTEGKQLQMAGAF